MAVMPFAASVRPCATTFKPCMLVGHGVPLVDGPASTSAHASPAQKALVLRGLRTSDTRPGPPASTDATPPTPPPFVATVLCCSKPP